MTRLLLQSPHGHLALHEVLHSSDKTLLEKMHGLRKDAWDSIGLSKNWDDANYADWPDKNFSVSRYWSLLHNNKIIAGARLSLHDDVVDITDADECADLNLKLEQPIASLNHLFVNAEWRGLKLSTILDIIRIDAAMNAGASTAILGSTIDKRTRALSKRGWKIEGKGRDGFEILTLDIKNQSSHLLQSELLSLFAEFDTKHICI